MEANEKEDTFQFDLFHQTNDKKHGTDVMNVNVEPITQIPTLKQTLQKTICQILPDSIIDEIITMSIDIDLNEHISGPLSSEQKHIFEQILSNYLGTKMKTTKNSECYYFNKIPNIQIDLNPPKHNTHKRTAKVEYINKYFNDFFDNKIQLKFQVEYAYGTSRRTLYAYSQPIDIGLCIGKLTFAHFINIGCVDSYTNVNITANIERGLNNYYMQMDKYNYFNADGMGLFQQYCQDNGIYDDEIIWDEMLQDPEDCLLIDFDDEFPLTEELTDNVQRSDAIFN
eukprot:363672_1